MLFDAQTVYGRLAEAIYQQTLSLSEAQRQLPELVMPPEPLLEEMAVALTQESVRHPGRAWGGAVVMELVAQQAGLPFWEAIAAVYQAWAANLWVKLELAWEAADKAEQRFTEQENLPWQSVTAWLKHAQPWMMTPQKALAILEPLKQDWPADENGRIWFPHYLFSLAWAYLMSSKTGAALETVAKIVAYSEQEQDPILLARIPFLGGAIRRSQGRYEMALEHYQHAAEQIARTNGTAFASRIWCGYGYALRQGTNRFTETVEALEKAAVLAETAGIPYWQGMAQNAQIQVYRSQGQLHRAVGLARQTRAWFAQEQAIVGLIESLIDSSTIYEELGQYQIAYDYIQEGLLLQGQHETHTLQLLTLQMYAGVLEWRLGKYQWALRRLEEARRTAAETDFAARAAEINIYIAHIWHDLDEIKQAEEAYNTASQILAELDNVYLQYNLITLETSLRMAAKLDQSLVDDLEKHIRCMEEKNSPLYTAQLQKLLAIIQIKLGQFDEAQFQLQTSLLSFLEMGVSGAQAEVYLWSGYIYMQEKKHQQAYETWQNVVRRTVQQPQVRWQAHAQLARLMLMQEEVDEPQVSHHYEQAIIALSTIRHMISQPSLLSQLLSDAEQAVYEAICFVGETMAEKALSFLEMSKAHALAVQIHQDILADQQGMPEHIQQIRRQLFEFQQELARESNRITRVRRQRDWLQLIGRYDALQAEYERSQQYLSADSPQAADFQLNQFRQDMVKAWHDDWFALDYLLYDDKLIIVCVSAEEVWVERSTVTILPALLTLLDDPTVLTSAHLSQLTEMLLPERVQSRLRSETVLLIAPYGRLHNLPWSALLIGGRPLVTLCQPLIIPALHLFSVLGETRTECRTGLLTAVAEFPERSYTPLPLTLAEADLLRQQADNGPAKAVVWRAHATWPALQTARASELWASFDCWHVATHAFFSEQTNARACGLALHDQDIWLDDLARLAPLPDLVTLSTCSGLPSKIFPGDDHAGLAATCLAAGSKNVVGSLWRMRDDVSQEIFVSFYQMLADGFSPLGAITQIQRQMIAAERPVADWGGLRISGRGS